MNDYSTWTGLADTDIYIFSYLPDNSMKNLVLVNKYSNSICSQKEFYRQRIISSYGVDIKSKQGESYKEIYRKVSINYYKSKYNNLDLEQDTLWYSFIQSCENGYVSLVSHFLEEGIVKINPVVQYKVSVSGKYKIHKPHVSSFYYTIMNKQWDILDILLQYGFQLKDFEKTIRILLSTTSDIKGYKRLIKMGLNIKDDSSECLRYATAGGHDDLSIFLIKNGATINPVNLADKLPPIVYAVRNCSVEVVKMLIDYGADVHICNDMIFGTQISDVIWNKCEIPRVEMIEYLKSINL